MKNMKLRSKIISGYVVVFLIGFIIGIIGLVSVTQIKDQSMLQTEYIQGSAGVTTVLNAHNEWRQALTVAGLTGGEFTGSLDPNNCALGKWLDSEAAKNVRDPKILSLIEEIKVPHEAMHGEAANMVQLISAGEKEKAEALLLDTILPNTEKTIGLLNSMEVRYAEMVLEQDNVLASLITGTEIAIIICIILGAALSVVSAIVILSSIMKPIRGITKAAETIAEGDLDVEVNHPVDDEIGRLSKAFHSILESTRQQVVVIEKLANGDLTQDVQKRGDKDTMSKALAQTIERLNALFADINSATEQVFSGAKQVADGATSLATGSTQQAATVQEFSATISEMQTQAESVFNMADHGREVTMQAGKHTMQSIELMQDLTQAMQAIDQSSDEISKVIKVIEDIAFQTNILALNAAVEAARAGTYGKGFAVVADEVRNLARKSSEAAKETAQLIQTSVDNVAKGNMMMEKTASSMNEVSTMAQEVAKNMDEMSGFSKQQSLSIAELSTAIGHISAVVQANSATAEQSAAASEEMSGQSEMLRAKVAQFKLKNNGYLALEHDYSHHSAPAIEVQGGSYDNQDVLF